MGSRDGQPAQAGFRHRIADFAQVAPVGDHHPVEPAISSSKRSQSPRIFRSNWVRQIGKKGTVGNFPFESQPPLAGEIGVDHRHRPGSASGISTLGGGRRSPTHSASESSPLPAAGRPSAAGAVQCETVTIPLVRQRRVAEKHRPPPHSAAESRREWPRSPDSGKS